jgi:HSP20 family protein
MTWSLFDRDLTEAMTGFAQLFDELWGQSVGGHLPALARLPHTPVDAWVSSDDAVVNVELPGVTPANINVSVEGDTLKVWGERQTHEPAEGEYYHRRERPSGKFERSIEVPFRIDPQGVEAAYENGVLKIRLPRAPESRPRKIEVKAG